MPDAGAVANPHINQANCQTLEWLLVHGYEVIVADWGQFFDKSQPDVDELLAQSQGNNIRYLSAQDYLARFQPEDRKPKPLGLISEEEWELTFGLPNFSAPSLEEFDWSNKGSIFDEAMRIINPLKTVEVTLKDVEQAIALIALKAPDLMLHVPYVSRHPQGE